MGPNDWMLIAGFGSGVFTLGFLMFVSVYQHTPNTNAARFALMAVLSLGVALTAGFIGGYAHATGKIGIPGNTLDVSLGGGIAAFVITFLLSHQFFPPVKTPQPSPDPPIRVSVVDATGNPISAALGVYFDSWKTREFGLKVPAGGVVLDELPPSVREINYLVEKPDTAAGQKATFRRSSFNQEIRLSS